VAAACEAEARIDKESRMSDESMVRCSVTTTIDRLPSDVFEAVADVTRIGDRSPECVACSWIDGAIGPQVGAKFSGDNHAKIGPVTLKKWTTESEVTKCEDGRVFEFVSEGYTKWRYELEEVGDSSTRVTESAEFPRAGGFKGFVYQTVLRRPATLRKGMETTLAALKAELEA